MAGKGEQEQAEGAKDTKHANDSVCWRVVCTVVRNGQRLVVAEAYMTKLLLAPGSSHLVTSPVKAVVCDFPSSILVVLASKWHWRICWTEEKQPSGHTVSRSS